MLNGRRVDNSRSGGLIRSYVMCELCKGKGWILTMNLNLLQWTIEKCDECNIFPDDESAGDQANAELV